MKLFWFMIMIVLALAACGSAQPTATLTPTTQPTVTQTSTPRATATPQNLPEQIARDPAQQAYVRIVHAAPDSPAINLFVETVTYAANLPFGNATGQTGISAGDYALTIYAADDAEAPLLETRLPVVGGESLILLFTGTPDARALSIFRESNEPLGTDESRVAAIHAVPRGSDFALRVDDNNVTSMIAFGQMSDSAVLPAGNTTIDFQAGATTLLSYPLELRGGHNYTLVLVGRGADPNSLAVISFESRAPQQTRVRAIHAAFDTNSIDVYLDSQLIGNALEYSRASERIETLAGARTASIYEAGADPNTAVPLFSQQLQLAAGVNISLIVLGSPDDWQFLAYVEDLTPTPESQARIGLVNTVPQHPTMIVETINGRLGDILYGQQADDVLINAGIYTVFWNAPDGEALETGLELQFEAGRSYLYLFTARGGEPPIIFSESVGTEGVVVDEESAGSVQVRFVNAIGDGSVVDFAANGTVVVQGLGYSDSSIMTLAQNTYDLTLTSAGTEILTSGYGFDESGSYTVFAYGDDLTLSQILVMPDEYAFGTGRASVRLINLSYDNDVRLGLAYSIVTIEGTPLPTQPSVEQPTPGTEATDTAGLEFNAFRQSLPIGAQIIMTDVTSSAVPAPAAVPIGVREIYILDTSTSEVAAVLSALPLEAGNHYDFVAFQENTSPRVRAFVLTYSID